jgi:short subunit dehydrogenase-like uncharacterized protein
MSLKDKIAAVRDGMCVILAANGNTGSIVANSLLSKGQKVRVVGRDAGRLQRFVRSGAEAFTAELSDAIAKAVKDSGLLYSVHLPIAARLFSMKCAARKCRTFKSLIEFSNA